MGLAIVKTESLAGKKPKARRSLQPLQPGPRVWVPPHEGAGVACSECGKRFKSTANMQRHFEDIHQPGEFPCRGCGKMFTSRNKMSSHYSRHCNPTNPNSFLNQRRRTLA